jgi:hypothetical protein
VLARASGRKNRLVLHISGDSARNEREHGCLRLQTMTLTNQANSTGCNLSQAGVLNKLMVKAAVKPLDPPSCKELIRVLFTRYYFIFLSTFWLPTAIIRNLNTKATPDCTVRKSKKKQEQRNNKIKQSKN